MVTDINPRFLTEMQVPNVEVRQHDIRTDSLEPDTYDLVHCRALLIHLPEPHLGVQRMVAALRLGGWLLVEESDVSSMRAVDATHPLAESFNRRNREIFDRIVHAKAFNPYLGCQVHGFLKDAGLTEIGNEGWTHIVQGGETGRPSSLNFQAFMERGFLSQPEYADHQEAFLDPSFSFISRTLFAAWGKRTS